MVGDDGTSATCECLDGTVPARDDSGNCLNPGNCVTHADCSDPNLPACDNEGTCHHPCDVETCGANESCAMADDFTTSCVCDENTFRSEATQECIAAGTCAGNLDCSMENPLCESGACIDPCAGACEDAQYCQILMDFSARCTCLAGFQDLDGDGSCTPTCETTACHENASCSYDLQLGEPTCDCNVGYTGDGFECTDTDACLGAPCPDTVECNDLPAPTLVSPAAIARPEPPFWGTTASKSTSAKTTIA